MNSPRFTALVRQLLNQPRECEWVEFKCNNANSQEIGEYCSALSNGAALLGKPHGYLVWGIEDEHRRLVGTTFRPQDSKVSNQELENWLTTQMEPKIDLQFQTGEVDGVFVALISVQAAAHRPVMFRGTEFIRVGSYKKRLADHPEKERALWALFSSTPFEDGVAVHGATSDDVLALIDYPIFFRLTGQPLPDNRAGILAKLASDVVIRELGDDRYDITNLGAVLFATSLKRFPQRLARKALRIIQYKGSGRIETIREQIGDKGYAAGYQGAISYIASLLPQNEEIGQALRREVRLYPELAIRELVANALIHQDFTVTGAGPMVELFDDRLEVSNPGRPLIDTLRFVDEAPRSRNEALASLMRRMHICEERGSGVDKVVSQSELHQLPAPSFRATDLSTVAVLHAPRPFAKMDKADRIRACYLHACLLWATGGGALTNASLRKRLGLADKNYTIASKIIADTKDEGLIRSQAQASDSKKDARYVPFWA